MRFTVTRRRLLTALAGLGVATAGAAAWVVARKPLPSTLSGADFTRGHRLRGRPRFPEPAREERTGIVIIGGGVAGLAAGWTLAEAGFDDFRLLELEDQVGGNARSGRNAVSAYPLGAHYLPVANHEATALRYMLTRLGMIIGEKDGAPVYDPYQLCADLEERLFHQGRWQEGLIPRRGLSDRDKADLARFAAMMAAFSARNGADGKPAFAIPIRLSSQDPDLLALDAIGFGQWIDEQRFTSPVLRAHLRYATRDDYGCEPADVSAWAGIHYFAGRRGWAADGAGDNQLTWPEGNGRLARLMADRFRDRIMAGRITHRIAIEGDGVVVDSLDTATDSGIRTRARAAIIATPHFIAARIAPEAAPDATGFGYAPWVVANVTVDRLPAGRGEPVAWDNVSATSESLGYVVATHQDRSRGGPSVLTWYMPLSTMPPADARRLMLARPVEEWSRIVEADLLAMNPELEGAIRRIDVWRWGHAMARPVPGFIWGTARHAADAARPPLFLAHSDLTGISIFEEAHYHGVTAAEGAMRHMGHRHASVL